MLLLGATPFCMLRKHKGIFPAKLEVVIADRASVNILRCVLKKE